MATTATRQDSLFYTHRLPNGLQLLGQRMPDVQSAAAIFWVCSGTRDENQKEMGVSHFLEHMAFRRTQTMTGEEIDRTFEEMGADHNAGTWKEFTFYWVRVLSENVEWAVQILSGLIQPVLDAQDFDQERNVILEEIRRYEDIPSHILLSHFMEDYFRNHPLAWETLGTAQTINDLTVEEMRAYWAKRYGTENILFAIAGNFDWHAIVAEVETLSRDWEQGQGGRTLTHAGFQPSFHVYTQDNFAQQQIALGTPSVATTDPRYYTAAALATILGDDTGSRLFWAINQTGLAETAVAQVMDFEDNGLQFVHLATEPSRAAHALGAAREAMRELQENGVEEDELARAKAKLTSSVIIGGESTNERVMGLINSWLTQGRLETLEEIREKIEAVTTGDIEQFLSDFPIWPQQVITSVGPLPESDLAEAVR